MFKQLSKILFIILVISKPAFALSLVEKKAIMEADKKIAEGVATVKDSCKDHVIKAELDYEPISKLQKRIDEEHELMHLKSMASEWQNWFPGTSINYAATTCKLAVEGVSTFCKMAQTPELLKMHADLVKGIKTVKCEFNYEPALKIVNEAIEMKASVSSDRKSKAYGVSYYEYPIVTLKDGILNFKFGIHASNVSTKVAEFLSSQ